MKFYACDKWTIEGGGGKWKWCINLLCREKKKLFCLTRHRHSACCLLQGLNQIQPFAYSSTHLNPACMHLRVLFPIRKFLILRTYLIFVTDATDGVRVNYFWPVLIFTDLTRKIGIFDRFYAKKWRFLQI